MERSDAHDARCPRCGAPKGPGHACGPGKPRPGGAAPIGYGATLAIGSAGADPAPADPRVGQTLGKNYRIVAPIGAGGMGVVYEVEHLALKKRFAAKLLSQELSRHPEAIRRFELEAQAASRLEHDNIINVIDYGCGDDGTLYLIMELLRGETLRARVERGRPSSDEILGIVAQVCQALGHAHAAGIVHRDMKPDNVFLARRTSAYPVVKVLDFGISKVRAIGDGRVTKQGQLLGSPNYMSPEAARGEEVDARADVYAVAVMLYELLCGEPPFHDENYLKVLQQHAAQAPRPPRALAPEISEAVERVVLRGLAKDPAARHAAMEELLAELMIAMPETADELAARTSRRTPPGVWIGGGVTPGLGALGASPAGSLPPTAALTPPAGVPTGATATPAPASPPTPAPGEITATAMTAPAGGRRWIAVVLGLGLAAIALAVAAPWREPAPPAPAATAAVAPPAPAPVASAPAPIPAAPAEVVLVIATQPPGAAIALDGEPIGTSPLEVRRARRPGPVGLSATLKGHRAERREIDLGADVRLELALTPIRPATPRPARRPAGEIKDAR